tara:strand:+ start:23 stop:433 length:411 start_codon:yes stop_codon:yes gene_type:complete
MKVQRNSLEVRKMLAQEDASLGDMPQVGGDTVAGQLFMMPPEVSAMIGKAVASSASRFAEEAEGKDIKIGRGDKETEIGEVNTTSGMVEIMYGYDVAGTVHYSKIKKNKSGRYTVKKGDVKFGGKDVDGIPYSRIL